MFTSIHLFTLGCDATCKFDTKRAVYQAAIDVGKEMITGKMVRNTEQFLVYCVLKNRRVSTFDDLW